MPELPEVEVTRRGIAAPLHGAHVVSVRLGKPLRWPLGCDPQSLVGSTVGDVTRRGKYLWLPLCREGVACGGLLLHLGMSGSLAMLPPMSAQADAARQPGPHDHFDLHTDRGTLRLNDPRRFGAVVWSAALDRPPAATLLQRLGPEPFDRALTPARFHAALHGRRTPIKALLLSGDAVVGAGNIYACEALFQAGIHPALRADRISRPRAEKLLAALRSTLGRALEVGGSTLRDFTDAHGVSGAYQAEAGVYGRAGLPCVRCGQPVRRTVQAQRSTFFCMHCQRR
jgi:formamidopyrimidine-DNA glycosylase